MRDLAKGLPAADRELAAFYARRAGRPLWADGYVLRPEADQVVRLVAGAERDGLSPQDYGAAELARLVAAARLGDPEVLARAELALSRAYGRYLADLKTAKAGAGMVFADPALAPRPVTLTSALTELAHAPSADAHIAAAVRMNPIYRAYRAALARARAGEGDPADLPLILANLERARALPAHLGERYVLVDAAAAHLWLYEDGQVVDTMPVAVGKPSQATPAMAGMIRYAVFNPYWNMPQDIVRERVAGPVARDGLAALPADLELLSDWTADARPLDPAEVDWAAVAEGRQPLRVRQKPSAWNTMGQVKLMLPNRLGIYLHDTPHRGVFDGARRNVSAGCVRLAEAPRLARRLLGGGDPVLSGLPEQRVDLPEPVPVYITYFTLGLEDGRLVHRADAYGRDKPLLAALERPRARTG